MGVSCYLCGRDFGRASFGIHLTTCRERWSREQGDPSVKQPSPPPGIEQALSGTLKGRQLIEFNRQSVALWKALVLKPCSVCSRTFFPNQLAKHQAACNNNMIKKYNINDILIKIYINDILQPGSVQAQPTYGKPSSRPWQSFPIGGGSLVPCKKGENNQPRSVKART